DRLDRGGRILRANPRARTLVFAARAHARARDAPRSGAVRSRPSVGDRQPEPRQRDRERWPGRARRRVDDGRAREDESRALARVPRRDVAPRLRAPDRLTVIPSEPRDLQFVVRNCRSLAALGMTKGPLGMTKGAVGRTKGALGRPSYLPITRTVTEPGIAGA